MPVLGQRNLARNQVDSIIRNLETSSDVFSRDFQRRNTTSSERRIVSNFENAIDRLRRNFDRNDNWWNTRNDVQSFMDESRLVYQMMNGERFARSLEVQWRNLRRDINALANTYELQGLDGGGWNGGPFPGGGGGGYNNPRGGNVPSWAQGTFYGRNPQTGGMITMSVQGDGDVTISFDGQAPTYASMNRTTLYNGPYTARVTRLNNGIRTTDVASGSTIDYFRTPVGGGGYYPPIGGGGNIPSWAIGTFQARNPQTGGTILMTIMANGSVSISFDGNMPTYASMNGTTLTNGGYVSRVTQIRNGIRTTDVNNGTYIDYFRR
jgi:hypothetical protein